MESLNLLQNYPVQDIQKRINFRNIIFSICLLIAGGIFFCLLPQEKGSNIDIFRICIGVLFISFSLYRLGFKNKKLVYKLTGSRIVKKMLACGQDSSAQIKALLADYGSNPDFVLDEAKGSIYVVVVFSQDKNYVALQFLQYTSFLCNPVSDAFSFEGEKAQAFFESLKGFRLI